MKRKLIPIDYVPPGSKLTFVREVNRHFVDANGKNIAGRAVYRCECGNEKEIFVGSVKRGDIKSCGCWKKPKGYTPANSKLIYIKEVVASVCENGIRIRSRSLYKCDCGTLKELDDLSVRSGVVISCGCSTRNWVEWQDDILRNHFPDYETIKAKTGKTHKTIKWRAKALKIYSSPKINIWHEKVPLEIRAYISGHFDGEGCASFRKRKDVRSPVLSVNACHRPVLELYKKYFNGNLNNGCKRVGKNKIIYRWKLVGYEDVYNFILAIIPFSLEKKMQLLCLKEYIETYLKNGKKMGFDASFVELSHNLHAKCTELKLL